MAINALAVLFIYCEHTGELLYMDVVALHILLGCATNASSAYQTS